MNSSSPPASLPSGLQETSNGSQSFGVGQFPETSDPSQDIMPPQPTPRRRNLSNVTDSERKVKDEQEEPSSKRSRLDEGSDPSTVPDPDIELIAYLMNQNQEAYLHYHRSLNGTIALINAKRGASQRADNAEKDRDEAREKLAEQQQEILNLQSDYSSIKRELETMQKEAGENISKLSYDVTRLRESLTKTEASRKNLSDELNELKKSEEPKTKENQALQQENKRILLERDSNKRRFVEASELLKDKERANVMLNNQVKGLMELLAKAEASRVNLCNELTELKKSEEPKTKENQALKEEIRRISLERDSNKRQFEETSELLRNKESANVTLNVEIIRLRKLLTKTEASRKNLHVEHDELKKSADQTANAYKALQEKQRQFEEASDSLNEKERANKALQKKNERISLERDSTQRKLEEASDLLKVKEQANVTLNERVKSLEESFAKAQASQFNLTNTLFELKKSEVETTYANSRLQKEIEEVSLERDFKQHQLEETSKLLKDKEREITKLNEDLKIKQNQCSLITAWRDSFPNSTTLASTLDVNNQPSTSGSSSGSSSNTPTRIPAHILMKVRPNPNFKKVKDESGKTPVKVDGWNGIAGVAAAPMRQVEKPNFGVPPTPPFDPPTYDGVEDQLEIRYKADQYVKEKAVSAIYTLLEENKCLYDPKDIADVPQIVCHPPQAKTIYQRWNKVPNGGHRYREAIVTEQKRQLAANLIKIRETTTKVDGKDKQIPAAKRICKRDVARENERAVARREQAAANSANAPGPSSSLITK